MCPCRPCGPPATSFATGWSAAEVGYRLLAERAKHGPWPELAAFDCYACHHGLTGSRKDPLRPRPGALVWNEPPLTAQLARPEFGDLRAALNRPLDVEQIQTEAGMAAEHWRKLAERWTAEPLRPADVARRVSGITPQRWDEACHLYYTILAIDRARDPSPPRPEPADLARVRRLLQLPRTADGARFNSPADLPGEELAGLFANLFRARSGRN